MALSSLFRRSDDANEPAPPAAARPALQALHEHLGVISDLTRQIEGVNARLQLVRADIRNHEQAKAKVQAARAALDQLLANARYAARSPTLDPEAPPDVEQSRLFVADLEAHVAPLAETARVASLVVPRLQKDAVALREKRAGMKPETDRLLHAACVEEGAQLAAEYSAAMEHMRSTAHKVFAAFGAADTIAKSRGYGTFFGSGDYADLHLPLPKHPAYQVNPLMPEAAQAAWAADVNAVLHLEAEQLINRLLNGEGD